MNLSHHCVGRRGNNCTGGQSLALGIDPNNVQPCHQQNSAIPLNYLESVLISLTSSGHCCLFFSECYFYWFGEDSFNHVRFSVRYVVTGGAVYIEN